MTDARRSSTVEAARTLYGGVAAHLAGDTRGVGVMGSDLAATSTPVICSLSGAATADLLRRINDVLREDDQALGNLIVDVFDASRADGVVDDDACLCARSARALLVGDEATAAGVACEIADHDPRRVAAAGIATVAMTLRWLAVLTNTAPVTLARQLCAGAARAS